MSNVYGESILEASAQTFMHKYSYRAQHKRTGCVVDYQHGKRKSDRVHDDLFLLAMAELWIQPRLSNKSKTDVLEGEKSLYIFM